MDTKNRRTSRASECGFSLIEILVALGVLTILGSVSVFAFNSDSSRAQSLYAEATEIGHAADRFALDTSCYPYDTEMLFSKTVGTTDTNNSCGLAVGSAWDGPYMKPRPVNSAKNVVVSFARDLSLGIWDIGQTPLALPGGKPHQYAVVLKNVPLGVGKKFLEICGNNCQSLTMSTMYTWGSTMTYEIFFVFAQT